MSTISVQKQLDNLAARQQELKKVTKTPKVIELNALLASVIDPVTGLAKPATITDGPDLLNFGEENAGRRGDELFDINFNGKTVEMDRKAIVTHMFDNLSSLELLSIDWNALDLSAYRLNNNCDLVLA